MKDVKNWEELKDIESPTHSLTSDYHNMKGYNFRGMQFIAEKALPVNNHTG